MWIHDAAAIRAHRLMLVDAGFNDSVRPVMNGSRRPISMPGEVLAIGQVGAYGASMSSGYNSRPLAPEVLVDGATQCCIRRRQTIESLIALEIHADASPVNSTVD